MSSRKILIYYEQLGYGGVDTHLANLINYWPNNEDEFIIASNPDNEGLSFLKQQLSNSSVTIHTLDGVFQRAVKESSKLKRASANLNIYIRFMRTFRTLLKEVSPDILLSNNGGYPGGITNWLAAIIGKLHKSTKISTFLLVHHSPTSKVGGPIVVLTSLLVWWIQFLDIPSITVSQASKNMLEIYTPLRNLHVINNGLGLKEYLTEPYDFKTKWNIKQDKILIGIIGPVDPHKGHLTMLEVFHHSSALQEKAHLIVVGSGKDTLLAELKHMVFSLGLENVITFTGFLPGDSHKIISGFDILVMPTIDFEGFGYSMAEAMSEGIPVVASRVGAIPEVIVDKESGFLVEPKDISVWQENLEKLINSADLRKKIGMSGRQRIQNVFSAHSMGQQYFNFLRNLQ